MLEFLLSGRQILCLGEANKGFSVSFVVRKIGIVQDNHIINFV